jgi:proline iminopeptidase
MHLTVNRTELFFDVEGPGLALAGDGLERRPTMIVLHGGPGFDQGYLRPGLSPLAEAFQLVFVDLRGQGRSAPAPLETCTLEQMADDVAALGTCLGIERPVLFGHSGGGFVALHVALRHPELAGGLILCHTVPSLLRDPDPSPPAGPAERGGPETAAASARVFGGDMSPAAMAEFDRLVLPLYAAPGREDLPASLMALSSLNAELAAHFFGELAAAYDVRPRLSEISVPALVMIGRHDWVCPPSAGRALADGIPGTRLVELESGHFGFSETPAEFLEAVRTFAEAGAMDLTDHPGR